MVYIQRMYIYIYIVDMGHLDPRSIYLSIYLSINQTTHPPIHQSLFLQKSTQKKSLFQRKRPQNSCSLSPRVSSSSEVSPNSVSEVQAFRRHSHRLVGCLVGWLNISYICPMGLVYLSYIYYEVQAKCRKHIPYLDVHESQ